MKKILKFLVRMVILYLFSSELIFLAALIIQDPPVLYK